jgi:hypothetical protein
MKSDIDALDLVPRLEAPAPRKHTRIKGYKSITNLLELLDSRVGAGVTEVEFRRLFVRCDCGHIFTKRAFRTHACTRGNEVIDLTED